MSERRALDAPRGDVVLLTDALLEEVLAASRQSSRRRVILPFHKTHDDPLHRMLNAMQPGTYFQPHRHIDPPKAEVFVLLRGTVDFIVFDDAGEIADAIHLEAGESTFGVDLAEGRYHTFLVRKPDTVIYEIKLGPYVPATAKHFAPWAPAEGDTDVAGYVAQLESRVRARSRGA